MPTVCIWSYVILPILLSTVPAYFNNHVLSGSTFRDRVTRPPPPPLSFGTLEGLVGYVTAMIARARRCE